MKHYKAPLSEKRQAERAGFLQDVSRRLVSVCNIAAMSYKWQNRN